VRCRVGHAPPATARTEASSMAGKGDEKVVTTAIAACAREPFGEYPALRICAQLPLAVTRTPPS
jgi:hypothetical protein